MPPPGMAPPQLQRGKLAGSGPPGALTPLVGDRKVEAMLGIKKPQ